MSLRVFFVLCDCLELWPGSRQSALTRRNRRLVSSLIATEPILDFVCVLRLNSSAEMSLVLVLIRLAAVSMSQVGSTSRQSTMVGAGQKYPAFGSLVHG